MKIMLTLVLALGLAAAAFALDTGNRAPVKAEPVLPVRRGVFQRHLNLRRERRQFTTRATTWSTLKAIYE